MQYGIFFVHEVENLESYESFWSEGEFLEASDKSAAFLALLDLFIKRHSPENVIVIAEPYTDAGVLKVITPRHTRFYFARELKRAN